MNTNLSPNELRKIKQKKIIFFGSTFFSKEILEFLFLNDYNIILCVTKPDIKKQRKVIFNDVKKFAITNKINVFQPLTLNVNYFQKLAADFFIICAYGKILKLSLLNLVESCINIHPSLLPKYQGAAPIQHALIDQQKYTGVSLIKTNQFIDQGQIYVQEKILISFNDDYFSLEKKLITLSKKLLQNYLPLILMAKFCCVKKQDLTKKSYAPKILHDHEKINFNHDSIQIYNQIRALTYIGAFAILKKITIKFLKSAICLDNNHHLLSKKNGTIICFDAKGIHIKTKNSCLLVLNWKISGKNYHSTLNYYKSHPKIINPGDCFES